MGGANVYPKGRQRYVYRRGERSSPLASLVAAPGIPLLFSSRSNESAITV
jgi:hypothetical protein